MSVRGGVALGVPKGHDFPSEGLGAVYTKTVCGQLIQESLQVPAPCFNQGSPEAGIAERQ